MERKVWVKEEFLNKYKELRNQGLSEKEIVKGFDMNYSDFRNLLIYFTGLSDDECANKIIERLKKSVDECGAMYINKKLWAPVDSMNALGIAVAVLKNEGYREWLVCMGKSEEKKKVYRILTSPKFDDVDIFDFVKKTGQVVDNKS